MNNKFTHVLFGASNIAEDGIVKFKPMHVKSARQLLKSLDLSEELCDFLPIHSMSIPSGHGWPWGWDLWLIPISKEEYLAAKRDGFIPERPNLIIDI